jgi:hypothetical protein
MSMVVNECGLVEGRGGDVVAEGVITISKGRNWALNDGRKSSSRDKRNRLES